MKHLLLILPVLLFARANAQVISGKIIDKNTRAPLKYIFIASTSGTTFTDDRGIFTLKISKIFDTIRLNNMGYLPFKMATASWGTSIRTIELEMSLKQLNEVTITGKKNYHKDWVALRREYAKQFNFRGPKFNEIFVAPSQYVPFAFMSINVTQLFRAIYKKHDPNYKLQQVLLRDERENHVSARFNKTLVSGITNLQGDSLENFMSSYRPTAAVLDKLSDYDLIRYIRTNLEKFKSNGGKNYELPKMLKEGESLE
ncbi:peptidase associated/transthyretin-like domain-containing protein [Mucilaginibacter pedocola]|uniref:Carboxypeptidase-like regulatory domain-containing protein n=1 Tax=Mucilaginibacter pedocola TaxID=1792845 RepID=A0A1S9PAR1_9SPHI|nr:hypothetical protein [Mucilaginibacter pedocola]OOQ58021.1 hypothetical protein BC343_10175 [Mucilaginibacter pedocola]